MLALKQEETVQDFIGQFKKYARMVKSLDESFLMEVILKGLKKEINAKVRLHDPKNLMESMVKVRRVEDKNLVVGKSSIEALKGFSFTKPYATQWYVKDWQPSNTKNSGTNSTATMGGNANRT